MRLGREREPMQDVLLRVLMTCQYLRSRGARIHSGPSAPCTGYGVGVPASVVNNATLVTQAVASSSPSLRTSPTGFGGKRAESPSLSVNSVLAGIASGSVGAGVPALTPRATVMSASTRKVSVPEVMYTRSTEGSAGSKGITAPGASLMRPSVRFAVPGDKTSIVPEASDTNDTPSGAPARWSAGGVASCACVLAY